MLLRREHTYAATPDEVFEMLADPEFRRRVSDAQDVHSAEITIEQEGDGFTYVNDQVQRTDGLPPFARKIAGDSTRAVQREHWSDPTHATADIEAPGTPVEMRGTIELTPAGAGTRQVTELNVKVKVPLIAGKLEKLLGQITARGIDVQHEVGDAWLRGER